MTADSDDAQPPSKTLTSQVYIMREPELNFLIAVHVPLHDVPLSNTALRSAVCSFANAMPSDMLDVPLVTLHWVSKPHEDNAPAPPSRIFTKRLELTLADTGTEQQLLALRQHAEQGVRYFAGVVSQLNAAQRQPNGLLVCASVEIRYNTEEELIAGNEIVIWDAEQARPLDDDMKQFIELCDAQV